MNANDVRPAGSPPLHWYVNLTFRFVDAAYVQRRQRLPVSFLDLGFTFVLESKFATLNVPDAAESFAIAEGRFEFTGDLITHPSITSHHSHNDHYQRAFLIRASLARLGLEGRGFYSPTGCTATETTSAGFESNAAMLRQLESHCPSCFSLSAPATRLLCKSAAANEKVGVYYYDRRSAVECASPRVRVQQGEAFTHIVFFGQSTSQQPFNPVAPAPLGGGMAPEHSQWRLWYSIPGLVAGVNASEQRARLPVVAVRTGELDAQMCFPAPSR